MIFIFLIRHSSVRFYFMNIFFVIFMNSVLFDACNTAEHTILTFFRKEK